MDTNQNKRSDDGLNQILELVKLPFAFVPIIGPVTNTFISSLQLNLVGAFTKRIFTTLEELQVKVQHLEEMDASFSFLASLEDDELNALFIQYLEGIRKTGNKEKLKAWNNAILNAAYFQTALIDKKVFFFHLLDSFSWTHLMLLEFFDNPVRWRYDHGLVGYDATETTIGEVIEDTFGMLRGNSEFFAAIVIDLQTAGLITLPRPLIVNDGTPRGDVDINPELLSNKWKAQEALEARTTTLGKMFLQFIREIEL